MEYNLTAEKSLQLSAAVKKKNLGKVKEFYQNGHTIRYTGSALANACCYGGPEIVKFLLENGASFSYEGFPYGSGASEDIKTIKDLNIPGGPYWFELFAVGENPKMNTAETCTLSGDERAGVLKLLAAYKCTYGFPQLLYRAIQIGDRPVAETLIDLGYSALPDWVPEQLSGLYARKAYLPGTERNYWKVIDRWIEDAGNEQLAWMIKTFVRCDRLDRFAFRKSTLYQDGSYLDRFSSPPLFSVCLALTNLAEMAVKKDIFAGLIAQRNADGLAQVLELGWCRKYTEFDDFVDQARLLDPPSPEVLAVLADYEKRLKKPTPSMSLDQDPFATAVVERSWRLKTTKTTADLVAYKGKALDVVVPPRVGKRRVRSIAPGAFDPLARGVRQTAAEIRRSLHSVVFPGSVKVIPPQLFHTVAPVWVDFSSWGVTQGCPTKLESIVLQDGVQVIQDNAFAVLPGLTSIEIPDSIVEIGDYAFSYCLKLRDIHLPDELRYLGLSAFEKTGIRSIRVPYSEEPGSVPSSLCRDAVELEECIIDDDIRWIDDYAFRGCEKLKKVNLPANLELIDSEAFRGCRSLAELELPQNLAEIASGAFYGSGLEKITIPKSVESLGSYVFCKCANLREVVFENPDTRIEPYAFAGCERLETISGLRLETIPTCAFMECKNLTDFDWDKNLHAIGAYAFAGSGIRSAILPESVRNIEKCAFAECISLSEVRIPEHTTIGDGVFAGCSGLESGQSGPVVHGTLYGRTDDYTYSLDKMMDTNSRDTAGPVLRSPLPASLPVRIARIPAGARLDAMYPEQDIIVAEGERPPGALPTRDALTPGETVEFGAFPQTADFAMEPIVWDVVRAEGEKVLLLSRKGLMFVDAFRFGMDDEGKPAVQWGVSRIRRILNDGFVPVAFTEEELACIVPVKDKEFGEEDYAFLLTTNQVMEEVPARQRRTELTDFAASQVPKNRQGEKVWLTGTESPNGLDGFSDLRGVLVNSKKYVDGGIRPALWVKLPKK